MSEFDMDKTIRSILWILVALVVLSSFSTGWFFVAKERFYNEYLNLENLFKTTVEKLNRQLASLNKENIDLKTTLEAVERQLSVLESESKELKFAYESLLSERDDINKELASVKKGKYFLEKRLKELDSDMFVAGLLKDKASLEVELNRLKDLLRPKDSEIEKLKTENMELDVKISKIESEKNLLEQKLNSSKEIAEVLSRDLINQRQRNEDEKKEAEDVKIENRILKTKVAELEGTAAKIDKLLAERETTNIKILSLERELEHKNYEIEKMKIAFDQGERSSGQELRAEAYHSPQEVELPPIVLQKDYYTKPSSLERIEKTSSLGSRFKGRIITVNREHNFVVVDLGRQDGIDIGSIFKVYRGDLLIGAIEVIQTRERISAADIKDLEEGFYVEVDDIVVK